MNSNPIPGTVPNTGPITLRKADLFQARIATNPAPVANAVNIPGAPITPTVVGNFDPIQYIVKNFSMSGMLDALDKFQKIVGQVQNMKEHGLSGAPVTTTAKVTPQMTPSLRPENVARPADDLANERLRELQENNFGTAEEIAERLYQMLFAQLNFAEEKFGEEIKIDTIRIAARTFKTQTIGTLMLAIRGDSDA